MNDFELSDASPEDIAKFNSTIEATEVLSEQIDSLSLKASAYGDLYLVDNEYQEILGQVTDNETYYVVEDVETGDFIAWFWDEASDQSEDGNAHVGYGIGIDMEGISVEELESLNSAFPPASENYSVDDIVHMRLVHWEKSDADGNVIHDWCHVQHFDESYDILGQVGYDGVTPIHNKCGCTNQITTHQTV